jgi:hypothetical protein
MEIQEALPVVRALAGGMDPETSQPLEQGSILLRPQVVKALNRALSALTQQEARERNKPANAGKYWSNEEDAKICEEVRQGIDLHEIAKSHNRSVGSIVTRLVKLGKIAPKSSPNQAA